MSGHFIGPHPQPGECSLRKGELATSVIPKRVGLGIPGMLTKSKHSGTRSRWAASEWVMGGGISPPRGLEPTGKDVGAFQGGLAGILRKIHKRTGHGCVCAGPLH